LESSRSLSSTFYVEPLGLYLVAESGTFGSLSLDLSTRTLQITFDGEATARPYSRLRLEVHKQGTKRTGSNFQLTCGASCPVVRGAFEIVPATNYNDPTTVTMTWT